jgi:hypothetical protein
VGKERVVAAGVRPPRRVRSSPTRSECLPCSLDRRPPDCSISVWPAPGQQRAELGPGERPFLHQRPTGAQEVLNIQPLQPLGLRAAGVNGAQMGRPHHRVQSQIVTTDHQMDRGPHQCSAHGLPFGDQPGQVLRPETFQPGPEPDIWIIGLLCLHPHQAFDHLGHRQLPAVQQQLPLEERAVERALAQHLSSLAPAPRAQFHCTSSSHSTLRSWFSCPWWATYRSLIAEMTSAPESVSGIVRVGPFAGFYQRFEDLIAVSTQLILYFIHSRRWRENHDAAIKAFLAREGTTLEAFLPDLENHELMFSLGRHFEDGPQIPALVVDAYRYFARLAREFQKPAEIWLFGRYPTFSFYKFDDRAVIALYSNTAAKKGAPAFEVTTDSLLGRFLAADVEDLKKECRRRSPEDLESVITSATAI